MAKRRSGWRTLGVVLAAYLLVVQATLSGMALGAQAATLQHPDVFTEIICSPSGAPADASQGPVEHKGLSDCCVLGCLMLGGGMAPGPEPVATAPHPAFEETPGVFAVIDEAPPFPERTSQASRAPPRTA